MRRLFMALGAISFLLGALVGVFGSDNIEAPSLPPCPPSVGELPPVVRLVLDEQIKRDRDMGLQVSYANHQYSFEVLEDKRVWVVVLKRGFNTYESYTLKTTMEGKVVDIR